MVKLTGLAVDVVESPLNGFHLGEMSNLEEKLDL